MNADELYEIDCRLAEVERLLLPHQVSSAGEVRGGITDALKRLERVRVAIHAERTKLIARGG